ncbi:MAG TPA: SH3 domain-containing protein, partial [Candidatus Limnocylindrales bacterium]|nr:SH3 domain-containing protein [Candidatus Limnocylindrales bacterium]
LAAEAARGSGIVPGSGLAVPGVPPDPEAHLPRWRRPSLLAARKADPIRDPTAGGQRLTFGQGLVAPPPGAERRRIRYHLVRLLDAPDEIRAGEIGMLDQGDEVALLERSGVYWRVQCPDGREGWIHKMTLGEAIAERDEVADAAWASAPADAAWASAPADAAWASAPADLPETSWSARRERSIPGGHDGPPGVVPGGSDGPTEIDDDVLRAFLQTRRLSNA